MIMIFALILPWVIFIAIGIKVMKVTKLSENASNLDVFFRALLLSLFFCPGFTALGYLPLVLPIGLHFILLIFALLTDWLSLIMNSRWFAVRAFLYGIALPYAISVFCIYAGCKIKLNKKVT